MGRMIKLLGLCALFHLNNAAEIKCLARHDFKGADMLNPGECALVDPEDSSKLTITEKAASYFTSEFVVPFTHYTTTHRTSAATQDFIHFKDEEKPLQAYTYYTPKVNRVTICSPYQCFFLGGVSTEFFITPSFRLPRDECTGKFIHAYNSITHNKVIGACVTLFPPGKKESIQVESTPFSFFYLSKEPVAKYHIIDHRSSPPKEIISENIIKHTIEGSPPLVLAHLVDYKENYISKPGSSKSNHVLGVTGTYYALQQRKDRRYMVQTHTNLYSLIENGSGLFLTPEEETFYENNSALDQKRRILLQVFPDNFRPYSWNLPSAMQFSALYKEAYGYENRKVDRTITGAYTFMAALEYLEAGDGFFHDTTMQYYANLGATYLYSVPTYMKCVNKEKELKKLKKALKESGNKDWHQVAQEPPLDDMEETIHAKDAEGGAIWYSEEEIEAIDKAKNNNTEKNGEGNDKQPKTNSDEKNDKEKGVEEKETASGWAKKWRKVGRFVLLVIVAFSVIVILVRRLRQKSSVDEVQPSSAPLNHEVHHII